jgi:beta-aspartyl-peptidase (threonine type)
MRFRVPFLVLRLALAAAAVPMSSAPRAAAAPVTAPPPASPAAPASDSLVHALLPGALSPPAPTVCVVPEDQDAAAVRRLLDEQVVAWNRGDLASFMAGYWRSDSLTFYSGGEVTHGWQVTFDRYRRRYQAEGREMGRLAFDPLEVQLLAPGLALARGGWHLKMSASEPRGLFTLWLRWFPDAGWRVVHDHSSAAS